jgi:hypothetical protein
MAFILLIYKIQRGNSASPEQKQRDQEQDNTRQGRIPEYHRTQQPKPKGGSEQIA